MRSTDTSELLREAERLFDAPDAELQKSARKAWQQGFVSGGEWMREALYVMRNGSLSYRPIDFAILGGVKYALAFLTASSVAVLAFRFGHPAFAIFAVLAFYAIEAQMVFLFPLAIDGVSDLRKESRHFVRQAGGTFEIMKVVGVLAGTMIFGGFCGRGFIRSWCLGCLAVLFWYERLRIIDEKMKSSERDSLEIFHSQSLHVRRESFDFLDNAEPIQLIYASDLHLQRNSDRVSQQLISTIRAASPDVIVLGGDLVDSKRALPLLTEAVKDLCAIAPVWAVAGNHDRFVGEDRVKVALVEGGGGWLGGNSMLLQFSGRKPFYLDGEICPATSVGDNRILCLHEPDLFPQAVERKYRLILAGHLHGGQCVLAQRNNKLYPAAWFYRWNGLRFTEGNSVMLVSRGVSDTLPVRWNCPREILLCEIH